MANLIELPSDARFLIENAGTFSVFDKIANAHRTPMQGFIAWALRLVMLTFASGKATHGFDYHKLPKAEKYEGLTLLAGENAFNVYHPIKLVQQVLMTCMSLGGWKDTALIGPDPEKADLKRLGETGWLYGYRIPGDNGKGIKDAKYSKMKIPGFSSILVLRGPDKFDAIGLDPETLEEIPLTGILPFIRRGVMIQ